MREELTPARHSCHSLSTPVLRCSARCKRAVEGKTGPHSRCTRPAAERGSERSPALPHASRKRGPLMLQRRARVVARASLAGRCSRSPTASMVSNPCAGTFSFFAPAAATPPALTSSPDFPLPRPPLFDEKKKEGRKREGSQAEGGGGGGRGAGRNFEHLCAQQVVPAYREPCTGNPCSRA
jgi:hypothetical protein